MVVPYGTRIFKERVVATEWRSKRRQEGGDETAVRERILRTAFAAFTKSGYHNTSRTLRLAVAHLHNTHQKWKLSSVPADSCK